MHTFMTMWSQQPVVWGIARVLVSSLWQIPLVGVVYLAVMMLTRRPQWRYMAGMVLLVAMVLLPPASEVAWLRSSSVAATPSVVMSKAGAPVRVVAAGVQVGDVGTRGDGWSVAMLRPVVALVWLVGIAYMALRFLVQYGFLRQIHRRAVAAPDVTDMLVGRLARALGVRAAVAIRVSADVAAPILVGVARPVILVPVSLMTGGAPEILEAMVAHELAHIRRRDPLMNLVQMLIETLLFYHPVMWLVSRHIRVLREMCTDELAAEAVGNRVGYARALSAMDELRDGTGTMALAAARGPLVARIRHLVGPRMDVRTRWLPVMCAVILLGLPVVLVGVAACGKPAATKVATTQAASPVTQKSSTTDWTDEQLWRDSYKKDEELPPDAYVVRVYDVRDILVGLTTSEYHEMAESVADRAYYQLVQMVRTVEDDWDPKLTGLSEYNRQMVVRQKVSVQIKIKKLLQQMRDAQSVQISTETRIFFVRNQQWIEQHGLEKIDKDRSLVLSEQDVVALAHDPGTNFLAAPKIIIFNGGTGRIEVSSLGKTKMPEKQPAVSLSFSGGVDVHRTHVQMKAGIQLRGLDTENRVVTFLDESVNRVCPDGEYVVACCKKIEASATNQPGPVTSWVVVVIRNNVIVQKEMPAEDAKKLDL